MSENRPYTRTEQNNKTPPSEVEQLGGETKVSFVSSHHVGLDGHRWVTSHHGQANKSDAGPAGRDGGSGRTDIRSSYRLRTVRTVVEATSLGVAYVRK
jgi:hypothetical protein